MAIEIRTAEESEFPAVAALLSRYSLGNLPVEEQGAGFVQGSFSADKVAWFAGSFAVLVALDRGAVVGVLCTCKLDEAGSSGPIGALIPGLEDWRLDGEKIEVGRCLGYGPVCIDLAYRGHHILKRLYRAFLQRTDSSRPYGVAFVDHENPGSLAAHVDGLGMRVLGSFGFEGRRLTALGFRAHG